MAMRAFTAAAVQVRPLAEALTLETVKANIEHALDYVERCFSETGAELIVLPESVTTGFTPGGLLPEALWDLVDTVPGALTEPFQELARRLGIHLVWGTYERGDQRGTVYNSAVLARPDGAIAGVYRKTHPYCTELRSSGGWVTPGNDPCVVDTELGRVGMMICFDGDYPELARITAVRGAEVIVRPSALLRSADLWELTNRARAYDNHVFVIGANCTGTDPAGVMYFGNSMIVTPIAHVVARAASHECWITARLDPDTAMRSLTPGSSIAQGFDHLVDRNLKLIHRYAGDLTAESSSPFSYGRPGTSR